MPLSKNPFHKVHKGAPKNPNHQLTISLTQSRDRIWASIFFWRENKDEDFFSPRLKIPGNFAG